MIKFEIKNRFSGEISFTAEIDCAEDAPTSFKIGLSVKWAIKSGADLSRADLSGANLTDANLTGAYLSRAYLSRADLTDANLSRAYLSRADLTDANLTGADLSGANLTDANLSGADLSRADLSRANLSGADLSGADLSGANLIDGGQRSDGWRFVGWIKDGVLMIRAGCRNLTLPESRGHWQFTRGGTPLGEETMAILDHIEVVATIRGLSDCVVSTGAIADAQVTQ